MTRELMTEATALLGEDMDWMWVGDYLYATLQDCAGFDEDWCPIEREYDDPEGVDAYVRMLDRTCDERTGGRFFPDFHYFGFTVRLRYASADE